ncbi:histidine phosphatase family protein [Plantactinospora sp. B24E8]|uniref:SixA phosphatase family protein n=1 Tax=Plantactinospora sp. B24E8 TaxID=3153567 RepID=UPI00325DABDA
MTDDQAAGTAATGGPDVPGPVRHLVLLRHAKAEQPTGGMQDADRPLSARGHADAAAAGAWLRYADYLPAAVVCSPAKRTRQTWHDAALGMAAPPTRPLTTQPGAETTMAAPTVRYEPKIYHGYVADLLDLVQATDPAVTTVLLVGHNPTISDLSTLLDPVHAAPDGLRTGGIVVHRVDGDWADLREQAGPIVKWHTARG